MAKIKKSRKISKKTSFFNAEDWSFEKTLFYLAVFLTPIFFLDITFFPVELNKQMLVGVLFLATLIYLVAVFLKDGKLNLPHTYITYGVLSLFGAVLISSVLSEAQRVSFLAQSPDSLFWVGIYVLAFFLGIYILKDRTSITITSAAFLSSAALLLLFAFLQLSEIFIFPFDFAQILNFNPVGTVFDMSFVLATAFVALVSYLLVAKPKDKKWERGLWLFASALALFILQINFWKTWLALAIAFLIISAIVGYNYIKQNSKSFRPLLVPFFIIIVAMLGVFIRPNIPSFLSVPAEPEISFSASATIVRHSLDGANMVWGTGPGTFSYNYAAHRPVEINNSQFWNVRFDHAYSGIMTLLTTWGVLGLLALLFVLFSSYKVLLLGIMQKRSKGTDVHTYGVALGAFSVALFGGISLFIYRANSVMLFLLFASVAVGVSALAQMGNIKIRKFNLAFSPKTMLASSIFLIVLISSMLGAVYLVGANYVGQIYVGSAVDKVQNQDIEGAIEKLNLALDIGQKDDIVFRVASKIFILQAQEIINDVDLDQEQRNTRFNQALQNAILAAQRAVERNPKEIQNYLQLGEVYEQVIGITSRALESAIATYEVARKLDLLNPSLLVAQARAYIGQAEVLQAQIQGVEEDQQQAIVQQRSNMLNSAIEKLGEAIELKPNYVRARLLLADTHDTLGNPEVAIDQMEQLAQAYPLDSDIIFQLGTYYYKYDYNEEAKDAFNKALTLTNGVYGSARFYLGLVLDRLGDSAGALAEFEILAQDNPDDQVVGQILDNLRTGAPALEGVTFSEEEALVAD